MSWLFGCYTVEDASKTACDRTGFVGRISRLIDPAKHLRRGSECSQPIRERWFKRSKLLMCCKRKSSAAAGAGKDRMRTARAVEEREERSARHEGRIDFRSRIMRLV